MSAPFAYETLRFRLQSLDLGGLDAFCKSSARSGEVTQQTGVAELQRHARPLCIESCVMHHLRTSDMSNKHVTNHSSRNTGSKSKTTRSARMIWRPGPASDSIGFKQATASYGYWTPSVHPARASCWSRSRSRWPEITWLEITDRRALLRHCGEGATGGVDWYSNQK